jgi:hypothetical protein
LNERRKVMSSAVRKFFACLLLLVVPGWQNLAAQKFPFPLPKPPVSIPTPDLSGAEERALGTLLDNQLPLRLDATTAFAKTSVLPGGPFTPAPLDIDMQTLVAPLPPGDYTVPVFAFCTEYSVHRPGAGVGYELGPLQGKAAQAIGTLFWRGMFSGRQPGELQAVAWGIQSGLTYQQMPKSYQAVIDAVIPDFKKDLSGNFVQQLEGAYQGYARLNPKIPPLNTLLTRMGKPGQLMLSAKRQQTILLQANTNDQLRTQTLFAGQESGVFTPPRAEEGPWTVVNNGAAYMRLKVIGGNMAGNNLLEIRVPRQPPRARSSMRFGARLVDVSQGQTAAAEGGASLLEMLGVRVSPEAAAALTEAAEGGAATAGAALGPGEILLALVAVGVIGYAIGRGAQALILVMARPSRKSAKQKSTDYPSWVDTYLPKPPDEDCDQFATRILNDKYGAGNWGKGPTSEYSQIKKACQRGGLPGTK